MTKYALILVGLLLLAGCRRIDDIGDTMAVPTPTAAQLIDVTVTAVPSPTTIAETPFSPNFRPTRTPRPTPTSFPMLMPDMNLILDNTLILYAAVQNNNWALKIFPDHPAFPRMYLTTSTGRNLEWKTLTYIPGLTLGRSYRPTAVTFYCPALAAMAATITVCGSSIYKPTRHASFY